jgi:methyl-accepting chemotaxis protein
MLDFLTQPIRWVLGQGERDVVRAVRDTRDLEENVLDAVQAIENATTSIEQHVAVIETLATSIDPLRASVDRLSTTLEELVRLLGPLAGAEHEVERVGRFFHRRRHEETP